MDNLIGSIISNFRDGFRFTCPPEVYYRNGALKEIAGFLKRKEVKNVLIISDEAVMGTAGKLLIEAIANTGVQYSWLVKPMGEPTDEMLSQGLKKVSTVPDAIAAIGGGSVIDFAKAINISLAHGVTDPAMVLWPSDLVL